MTPHPTPPAFRPLFAQIKELIVERVKNGEWQPGEPLPSEAEFAVFYQASPGTVRKAISEMAAENLVVRFRGKGTFVASHTQERALSHFFKLFRNDGGKDRPSSRPLSCRRRKATREMGERLGLETGHDIVVIERQRILGDTPLIFETIVVPESLFPDLCAALAEGLPNEFYPYYETRYGVRVIRAIENLRSVAADERDAEVLGIAAGAPLLEIDRVAVTYGDQPVEWRRSRCNTVEHFYQSVLY